MKNTIVNIGMRCQKGKGTPVPLLTATAAWHAPDQLPVKRRLLKEETGRMVSRTASIIAKTTTLFAEREGGMIVYSLHCAIGVISLFLCPCRELCSMRFARSQWTKTTTQAKQRRGCCDESSLPDKAGSNAVRVGIPLLDIDGCSNCNRGEQGTEGNGLQRELHDFGSEGGGGMKGRVGGRGREMYI